MVSISETGYAKNGANFQDLNTFSKGYHAKKIANRHKKNTSIEKATN